jgi:hypothetical protein
VLKQTFMFDERVAVGLHAHEDTLSVILHQKLRELSPRGCRQARPAPSRATQGLTAGGPIHPVVTFPTSAGSSTGALPTCACGAGPAAAGGALLPKRGPTEPTEPCEPPQGVQRYVTCRLPFEPRRPL